MNHVYFCYKTVSSEHEKHIMSTDGYNFDLSLQYGVQVVQPHQGEMGHGKMLRD